MLYRERFKRVQFFELLNLTLHLLRLLEFFLPLSKSFRINLNLVFSNQNLLTINQFSSQPGIQSILTRTTVFCSWRGLGWKKHVRACHHSMFFVLVLNFLPHLYFFSNHLVLSGPQKKKKSYVNQEWWRWLKTTQASR